MQSGSRVGKYVPAEKVLSKGLGRAIMPVACARIRSEAARLGVSSSFVDRFDPSAPVRPQAAAATEPTPLPAPPKPVPKGSVLDMLRGQFVAWDNIKEYVAAEADNVVASFVSGVKSRCNLSAADTDRCKDVVVEQLLERLGGSVGISPGASQPAAAVTPKPLPFSKYGVDVVRGVFTCKVCNVPLPESAQSSSGVEVHLVSDHHDEMLGAVAHLYAVPGGLDARRKYREDRKRKRDTLDSNAERKRRLVDFHSLPAVDPVPKKFVPAKQGGSSKDELNKSWLRQLLTGNASFAMSDSLHEWLRLQLRDGGLLLKRSWLTERYLSEVVTEQNTNIRAHIDSEKEQGLVLMLDGTSDHVRDKKPINFLVACASHLFYCDTKFQSTATGGGKASALRDVVQEFYDDWFTPETARYVTFILTDNVSVMELLGRLLSSADGMFPNAQWLGCLTHGFNRVGLAIKDHTSLHHVRQLAQAVSSLLKGKINVSRRQQLRQALADAGKDSTKVPSKWADTRWSAWFSVIAWLAENLHFLKGWASTLKSESAALRTVNDLLASEFHNVRALAMWVFVTCQPLFNTIEGILQAQVVPTKSQEVKCCSHRMFTALHEQVERWTTQAQCATVGDLPVRVAGFVGDGRADAEYIVTAVSAMASKALKKATKYMNRLTGQIAAQLRVFDPKQRLDLPSLKVADYSLVISPTLVDRIGQDWDAYLECTRASDDRDLYAEGQGAATAAAVCGCTQNATVAAVHRTCRVVNIGLRQHPK